MRTLSIFDGGYTTYPKIFKRKEKTSLNTSLLIIKIFCLGPDKKFNKGTINSLKHNLGIEISGIPTFKTPYISKGGNSFYNGYNLNLKLEDNIVSLRVSKEDKFLIINCWELHSITKALNIKNAKCDFITDQFVGNLIQSGKLSVQFRVSIHKNHGTYWKLDL
ncbi:hypothetical protein [Flavobacterium sp. YJ01]|uniref:hypothetical protein n=1 Tax=unclassified Flavobacterium TaxID=196869 RepID=UPI0023E37FA2|nr:hypothetical protein [Flavobacterium sp. YJ01]WET00957.1 hypothetical protein P0R33_14370 [Flavobacterium sp. YJ01]